MFTSQGHIFFGTDNSYYGQTLNKRIFATNTESSIPHGKGTQQNKKYKYMGEWYQGQMSGNGFIVYNDNTGYNGQWNNNQYNGRGTVVYTNGNNYEGEWKNSKLNGNGNEKTKCDKYEGQFTEGRRNGFGIQITDGFNYLGHWCDDVRSGVGIIKFSNQNTYIGIFNGNQITGKFININNRNQIFYGYYNKGLKESEFEDDELTEILNLLINSNIPQKLKDNIIDFDNNKINIINKIFGGNILTLDNNITNNINNLDNVISNNVVSNIVNNIKSLNGNNIKGLNVNLF